MQRCLGEEADVKPIEFRPMEINALALRFDMDLDKSLRHKMMVEMNREWPMILW